MVFCDDRSADVPIPYLLFSQTKTTGRFHSLACRYTISESYVSGCSTTCHVVSLEHLTLVGSTVSVHREGDRLPVLVLLRESDTGSDGHLSTDDTVTSVEAFGEHVHRTTLALGDTSLLAYQSDRQILACLE